MMPIYRSNSGLIARLRENNRSTKGEISLKLQYKWTLAFLTALLAFTLFLPNASANSLNQLEQKKQEVEQQQRELNSGINQKANEISENQSTLEKIMAKIQELDNKIQETETKVTEIEQQIAQTNAEIDALKASIAELERKIAEREELLQERARAIQLSGGSVDYIDVLLGANSFVDFIDRFSAVNTLIEADREIMREQAADKELLAKQQAEVESKLATQEQQRAELVELKNSLDAQKAEQADLVQQLKKEQERLAKEKADLEKKHDDALNVGAKLEKQIADEQARLAELARKAEEERQRKAAAEKKAQEKARAAAAAAASANARSANVSAPSVTPVGSSNFIRPAAGRHTSGFGGRNIGEGHESHLGYDIANSTGTPIVASASGFVSYAGSMGGYGNVIILTHSINGQTHSTVYAHLNSIGVSVGQSVSQGQRIGGMGNTGRSTGTHLHFEIHVGPWNGSRSNAVNPAGYIGS